VYGYGERIRKLRKAKGLSMGEVADAVGVARSTYAGYETEYREPSLDVLKQLAVTLETSVDYLLGLTDNPSPKDPDNNLEVILRANNLHWDGVPLTEDELQPIRDLLRIVARERAPHYKTQNNREEPQRHTKTN
jgi:transcriptional regulator with XRE-family HTH domain